MKFWEYGFKHWLVLYLSIFGNAFAAMAGLNRQEEICTAVDHYPLMPMNKGDDQYAVDLAPSGLVYNNPENALPILTKTLRSYAMTTRRIKLVQDSTATKEDMGRQITAAAKKDIKLRGLEITDAFNTLTAKLHYSLTLKREVYHSALQTQTESSFGNCGEHADLAIAYYLKEQMQTGEKKQLQRFVLILHGEDGAVIENHAFVVENSGVSGQTILNDPAQVKAVLEQVDNQNDAYLCDHHFNHEKGIFGEVRQRNKVYGIGSQTDWTSLKIIDFNIDIDLSLFPQEAVELRKTYESINQELNTRFMKDILLPIEQVDKNQLTR